MKKRIGFSGTVVGALALAVFGPTVAQSQIVYLCFPYQNSRPDAGNNYCHGMGGGCLECVLWDYSMGDGEGTRLGDSPSQSAMAASYPPRLDRARQPSQPVSLAFDAGLPRPQLEQAICGERSLYDRVRRARLERRPSARKDRASSRSLGQVSAP